MRKVINSELSELMAFLLSYAIGFGVGLLYIGTADQVVDAGLMKVCQCRQNLYWNGMLVIFISGIGPLGYIKYPGNLGLCHVHIFS